MRAICFDADGTLYYSGTTVVDLWLEYLRLHGCATDRREVEEILNQVSLAFHPEWAELVSLKTHQSKSFYEREECYWRKFNKTILAEFGLTEYADEVRQWFNNADLDSVTLFNDVLPSLDLLHGRGVRAGVYSNRPTEISSTLQRLGIEGYFAWVATAGQTGFAKPDRRAFLTISEGLKAPLWSIVYVGDSFQDDYSGAISAGCRALLLDRTGRNQHNAQTIKTLTEIIKYI